MRKLVLLFVAVLLLTGCDAVQDIITPDMCYTVRVYTWEGELVSETFEYDKPTGDIEPPGAIRVVIPGCE